MTDRYRTLAAEHSFEPDPIKGSRFLATVAPVSTPDEAAAVRDRIARRYDDARHVCWAWRLGPEGGRTRSTDDGEPSGSAGRPILAQLEGHDVTDLIAVVVRYFGGVKLGVGGLMRAYGGAAGQCLDRARIREVPITERVEVEHPYDCSAAVQSVLTAHGLAMRDAGYGASVTFAVDVPRSTVESFRRELVDRTAARARIR